MMLIMGDNGNYSYVSDLSYISAFQLETMFKRQLKANPPSWCIISDEFIIEFTSDHKRWPLNERIADQYLKI